MITIKEIAPYLPFSVRAITTKKTYINPKIGIIDGWDRPNKSEEFCISTGHGYYLCGQSEIKLILRPLSDLTKEIEINGEKFVAIVELAQIYEGFILGQYKTTIENDISAVKYIDNDGFPAVFAYHFKNKCFGTHTVEDGYFHVVLYQLQLFQKLFEWHFDVFELIERGDAIDTNTLNYENRISRESDL